MQPNVTDSGNFAACIKSNLGTVVAVRESQPKGSGTVTDDSFVNTEAEKIVLSSLLGDRNGEVPLLDLFAVEAHRTIYSALAEMEDLNIPADIITLTQFLRERGQLESVGGPLAVTQLETGYSKSTEIVKYYLSELRGLSAKRKARALGKRLNEGDIHPADALSELTLITETVQQHSERVPRIRFHSPSELRTYEPPTDVVLVGDCHVMRGEVFVIGGEPGVGKSRAATSLAIAGAQCLTWLGLTVHRPFKTMIIQTENGRYRLRQEYRSLPCNELDDWIRVSEPPAFGLTLTHPEFQQDIGAALESFKPDCVILDPWNAAARDDKQRDYSETFDALRNLLPVGPDKPALGIVAHTRKPHPNEKRTGGTGLMHLLSGSYVLTSVPRCIFVMVRGNEDESDNSIVWCNPKNSNGPLATRSAWCRLESGFLPDLDFDWREFDKPPDKRATVRLEDLAEVFADGGQLELKEAAHKLATTVGINERSAYNALSPTAKFADHLTRTGNMISFRAA
jgi:hypothetical protein